MLQIKSARITNYGCFHDSGDVPIDSVTALIAENENGKTTFLRALAWWGDAEKDFDEDDRWEGANTGETLDLVRITFDVPKEVATELRNEGIVDVPSTIRVTRDSNGEYTAADATDPTKILAANREFRHYDNARAALVARLRELGDYPLATDLANELEAAEPDSGVAQSVVQRVRDETLPHVPGEQHESVHQLTAALEASIANPIERVSTEDVFEVLEPFVPRVIYFDDQVDFVQDSVTYAEVSADPSRHRTMINLAEVAGVDLIEVASLDPHRRQLQSRTAEHTLSSDFSKYWQGEPVTIYVQLDESQMTLTIEHKGRTQRPSRRSSGLKWHLGFFVNFSAEVKGDLSGAVLLLDEPGLRLHIKQQPMLLNLFDDLAADGCHIIYSTHLGHMLSPNKPHTFRPLIADPDTPNATRVVPNITALPSKSDVMQPVRQVLGMGIADAIGLGGRNVIAEGWAERYVLLAMSERCRETKRNCLSATTTVLPAGGTGKKMLPLASMAVAERTKVVVLVDDDSAGRSTSSLLERTLPGAVTVVRTHEQTTQTGLELEDLFARDYFLDLVNSAHKDVSGYGGISTADLGSESSVCDAVSAAFKAKGLGDFQKLRPAIELARRVETGEDVDDVSLDQFSELFGRLSAALAKSGGSPAR